MNELVIAGQKILPGERKNITIGTARLYDFTTTGIPVVVIRGKKSGPTLFVSAAIHGDEINGVDIVKRLLNHKRLRYLRGTLIAVPIVNVFGFNTKSRYLPDRRDLNRCFPGLANGSMASQMAHIFMNEIVMKCTHGIDLHTGAIHRSNLPQVRGSFDHAETRRIGEAFSAPVMIHSSLRDGSLREAAGERNIPVVLFEGGEALRFDETVSRTGVRGIIRVMEAIDMLPCKGGVCVVSKSFIARNSQWIRAPHSGILTVRKHLGDRVKSGEVLGIISDPIGDHSLELRSKFTGIIIGVSMIPLFNKGDAVFHIASFDDSKSVEANLDKYQEDLYEEPLPPAF